LSNLPGPQPTVPGKGRFVRMEKKKKEPRGLQKPRPGPEPQSSHRAIWKMETAYLRLPVPERGPPKSRVTTIANQKQKIFKNEKKGLRAGNSVHCRPRRGGRIMGGGKEIRHFEGRGVGGRKKSRDGTYKKPGGYRKEKKSGRICQRKDQRPVGLRTGMTQRAVGA